MRLQVLSDLHLEFGDYTSNETDADIHLIEELTNQSTNILMSKELIDEILKNKESLQAFYTLNELNIAVQAELITRLKAQLDNFAKETGLELQVPIHELSKEEGGFTFTTRGLSQRNLVIRFMFNDGGYTAFLFGFSKIDKKLPCPVADQLLTAFSKEFSAEKPDDEWPAWAWWDEYHSWRRAAFEAICSGTFAKDLKELLEKLAKIANQVCPDESVVK